MSNKIATTSGLRDLLNAHREKIAEAISGSMKLTHILKAAMLAASKQPQLLECTHVSMIRALITAASLGLDPSGNLGSGYLVPRWNSRAEAYEAHFQPGYRGLIDLARRSGAILTIEARVVYQMEIDEGRFDLVYGDEQKVTHRPILTGERGEIAGAYTRAVFTDGVGQTEWMSREELDSIRDRFGAKNRDGRIVGPWVSDYPEMCRKTVVLRGMKYLPLSPEIQSALGAEYESTSSVIETTRAHVEPGNPSIDSKTSSKSERMAARLAASGVTPVDMSDDVQDEHMARHMDEKEGKEIA